MMFDFRHTSPIFKAFRNPFFIFNKLPTFTEIFRTHQKRMFLILTNQKSANGYILVNETPFVIVYSTVDCSLGKETIFLPCFLPMPVTEAKALKVRSTE